MLIYRGQTDRQTKSEKKTSKRHRHRERYETKGRWRKGDERMEGYREGGGGGYTCVFT